MNCDEGLSFLRTFHHHHPLFPQARASPWNRHRWVWYLNLTLVTSQKCLFSLNLVWSQIFQDIFISAPVSLRDHEDFKTFYCYYSVSKKLCMHECSMLDHALDYLSNVFAIIEIKGVTTVFEIILIQFST